MSATGTVPQTFSYNISAEGNTTTDMKWRQEYYLFTASVANTKLSFASETQDSSCGIALDNVVIEEILPPSPTNTPTPIPSVIPSSTPTQCPMFNHSPVITTKRLPSGKINKKYIAWVSGYDKDKSDLLNMNLFNLPNGLNKGHMCSKS